MELNLSNWNDPDFLRDRIYQQSQYVGDVYRKWILGDMTYEHYCKLYDSARDIKRRYIDRLKEMNESVVKNIVV